MPGVMGLPYVWRGYPFKAPAIQVEADDYQSRQALGPVCGNCKKDMRLGRQGPCKKRGFYRNFTWNFMFLFLLILACFWLILVGFSTCPRHWVKNGDEWTCRYHRSCRSSYLTHGDTRWLLGHLYVRPQRKRLFL